MRFVHNDITDIHLLHIALEKSRPQTLRRHIQKLEITIKGIVECRIHFPASHASIDAQGPYAPVRKILHLILHQGDKRSHNYGYTRTDHRRHLEAHGFSASSWQNGKHVPPFQCSPDDVLLLWPEGVVTPVFLQDFKGPVVAFSAHFLSFLSFSKEKACIVQQM